MLIRMMGIYRILGMGGMIASGLTLLAVLLIPEPNFVTFVRTDPDGKSALYFFYLGLLMVVFCGFTYLYGQIRFRLETTQMVVLLGKRVWLTVEHERMTAVRYRTNWLQIRWQGRGAWLSYWLSLPARELKLLDIYGQWLPIVKQEIAKSHQDVPAIIKLRLKASFLGMVLVFIPLFHGAGWGMLATYLSGNSDVEGWGGWLIYSTAIFFCISLGMALLYLFLWQTGWQYTFKPQQVRVRYGLRRKIWQSPLTITRSHRIYNYKGIPQRIEQVILMFPNEQTLTLESNELAYQKHLPPPADFDLLASHLQKLYQL